MRLQYPPTILHAEYTERDITGGFAGRRIRTSSAEFEAAVGERTIVGERDCAFSSER
jgi:hypothetical protein